MDKPRSGMAQQIAQTAKVFEQERTGHRLRSAAVVRGDGAPVITLHGALSEAAKA